MFRSYFLSKTFEKQLQSELEKIKKINFEECLVLIKKCWIGEVLNFSNHLGTDNGPRAYVNPLIICSFLDRFGLFKDINNKRILDLYGQGSIYHIGWAIEYFNFLKKSNVNSVESPLLFYI